MKRIYNLLLFSLASTAIAQTPDTARLVKPTAYPVTSLGTQVLLSSGSNGMNQFMLNRLAFGGYMSPAEIDKAAESIKKMNRTGFLGSVSVYGSLIRHSDTGYRKKWRFKPTDVMLSILSLTGLSYSQGAFQMIFQGNEPFLGKKLDFGNSGFRQFNSRTFYLDFQNAYLQKRGNESTVFSFAIGLSQLTSYRNLKISQGSLYTDSNRNYLDVQYSGNFDNGGRNSGAGVGYGLMSSMQLHWQNQKNRYYFSMNNLGIYYLPKVLTMTKNMNQEVRINQTQIGLKSLNTDNWIDGLKDTINNGLGPDSVSDSRWMAAPFRAQFMIYSKKVIMGLEYIHLPGYIPRFTISPLKSLIHMKSHVLRPELQLGGFDTYDVNLKFLGTLKQKGIKELTYNLKIQGIEGLVLPKLEHGAGISFGLNYVIH